MAVNPLQSIPSLTPSRHFSNWLEAYAEYTENTEAPKNFRAWTAISTIAGALGRKTWVNIGRFSLSPSFYLVFVAPPGIATKSTTANSGIDLLKATKKAHIFSGSITRQAILDELEDGLGQVQIGKQLLEMTSMTMFASELGTLMGGSDMQLVDTFVDIWDNKPEVERRTKGEGKRSIARPFINLMGCTTPRWLEENSQTYNIDGGLFSRTIFVYANDKEKLIAYPEETTTADFKRNLVNDLGKIGSMRGEFTLTPEAREWGEEWYNELYTKPPAHLANEMFSAYISRRQAHLHKTALVISAATAQDQVITLEHLILAEALLETSEHGLNKIYNAVNANERTQAYSLVLRIVNAMPNGVTKSTLFRMIGNKCTLSEFEAGLQAAIFAGQIKLKDKGGDYVLFPRK